MILCKILLQYGCLAFHSHASLIYLSWLVFCLNTSANKSTYRSSISPTGQLRPVFSTVLILVLFLNTPALPSAMDTFGSLAKPAIEDILYNIPPLIGLQNSNSSPSASIPAFGPASAERTKASHSFDKTSAQQFFKYMRIKFKKTVRNLRRVAIKKIPLRWKFETTKWFAQTAAPLIGKLLPWLATKIIPRIAVKGIPGLNAVSLGYDAFKIVQWSITKAAPLVFRAIAK
jgi:hypothetical protein